jgi:hypothetical protein
MILIISCNNEKEIQLNDPLPDIEIYSDKNLYSSSEQVILTIKNNYEKDYSVGYLWPSINSFLDPFETKEIFENGSWTHCPMPPFAGVHFSYELLKGTNQTINDTLDNLTNLENGTYRLKYRLRLENADTIFYSNEFGIIEN